MLSGLLLAAVAPALACEPLAPLLDGLESQVLALDADKALARVPAVEASLTCQAQTDPVALARAWIVIGVAKGLADQSGERDLYLAAARQVAPTWRSPAFPDDMQAAPALPVGSGTLNLSPDLGAAVLRVDGISATPPATLLPGLRLIQVIDTDGSLALSRLVEVADGDVLELTVELTPVPVPEPEPLPVAEPEPVPAQLPPAPVEPERHRRRNLLLTAAALGAVSGATGVVAWTRTEQMLAADRMPALNQAFGVQIATGSVSYLTAAASLTCVALSFRF